MVESVAAAAAGGRRRALVAVRDKLARELDSGGHRRGCDCECGPAADGRVMATLAKQLVDVVRELDSIPSEGGEEASPVVDLTARIDAKLRGHASAPA